MSDNLTEAPQSPLPKAGEINCLFTRNYPGAGEVGLVGKLVVSLHEMGKEIQGEGAKLEPTSVLALRNAEQAVEKLFLDHNLINSYGHFGLRCTLPEYVLSCTGTSLGVSVFIGTVSLLTERPISERIACTGEITINNGTITIIPVGSLPTKLAGAARHGTIKQVIIPSIGEKEFAQLKEQFSSLDIIPTPDVKSLLSTIFGNEVEPILFDTARRLNERLITHVARDGVGMRSFRYDSVSSIRKVDTPEEHKRLVEQFYHGKDISLEAIHNNLTVQRSPFEAYLLKKICAEWTRPRLCMIFSDRYQGKTTLLRRLQYELLARKKVVLWKRSDSQSIESHEVERLYAELFGLETGKEPIYLLIDELDFNDSKGDLSCENFLNELASSKVRVVIVATSSRDQKDHRIFKRFQERYQCHDTTLVLAQGEELPFIRKLQEVKLLEPTFTYRPGENRSRGLSKFLSRSYE